MVMDMMFWSIALELGLELHDTSVSLCRDKAVETKASLRYMIFMLVITIVPGGGLP